MENVKELLTEYHRHIHQYECDDMIELLVDGFLSEKGYSNNSAQAEALSVGNNEQAKEFQHCEGCYFWIGCKTNKACRDGKDY